MMKIKNKLLLKILCMGAAVVGLVGTTLPIIVSCSDNKSPEDTNPNPLPPTPQPEEKQETKVNTNITCESLGLPDVIPLDINELNINQQFIMDNQSKIFVGNSNITSPNQVSNLSVTPADKANLRVTFTLAQGTWYDQTGALGSVAKSFEIIIHFVSRTETVIMSSRKNNGGVIGYWSGEYGSLPPEITLQFNQLIGMGNNSQSVYAIVPLDTNRNPISDKILLEALARNIEIEVKFINFSDGSEYGGQKYFVELNKTKSLYDWTQDNSLVINPFPEQALVPNTNMPLNFVDIEINIKFLKTEIQIGDIKYKLTDRDFSKQESIILHWDEY